MSPERVMDLRRDPPGARLGDYVASGVPCDVRHHFQSDGIHIPMFPVSSPPFGAYNFGTKQVGGIKGVPWVVIYCPVHLREL